MADREAPPVWGLLEGVTLCSFLQILHSDRRDATIEVRSQGRRGRVHVQAGEVIHAQVPGCSSVEAISAMLGWQDLRLRIGPLHKGVPRTIFLPLPGLLLQAAVHLDERGKEGVVVPFPAPPGQPTPQALHGCLDAALRIPSALAAAVLERKSGRCLTSAEQGPGLGEAAVEAGALLCAQDDREQADLEEVQICRATTCLIGRPMARSPELMLIVLFSRRGGNPGMARYLLAQITAQRD